MKYPIKLHSSILGLSWDNDGKPYNYRTLTQITIDAEDIVQISDHFDDKNKSEMNFCCLLMDYSKYGDNNKIQVAESMETINNMINAQKIVNGLV